ncbi:hypothetical protein DWUX_1537 [Desulfovibrio diazotrophicus]|nr:hypothetical protein DWUX_1537 [Desulfovibrio diazotrophicus]
MGDAAFLTQKSPLPRRGGTGLLSMQNMGQSVSDNRQKGTASSKVHTIRATYAKT